MPSRKPARSLLRAWLDEHRPDLLAHEHFEKLRAHLAPISGGYLRRLLRECGTALAPLVEGVRQDSYESLERTLLALAAEYAAGHKAGARRLVIEAKDHARLAARRREGDALAAKQEMILWMLTWLENPAAFPVWLRLRKAQLSGRPPSS